MSLILFSVMKRVPDIFGTRFSVDPSILMRGRAVGIDKRQNGSAFIQQFYLPVVEHF
jgi:hypothetical protein